MLSRDFRRGLRQCAPNSSRAAAFRDLDNCWGRASHYRKLVDKVDFAYDEADEIVMELKYVYKMQMEFMNELEKKHNKERKLAAAAVAAGLPATATLEEVAAHARTNMESRARQE